MSGELPHGRATGQSPSHTARRQAETDGRAHSACPGRLQRRPRWTAGPDLKQQTVLANILDARIATVQTEPARAIHYWEQAVEIRTNFITVSCLNVLPSTGIPWRRIAIERTGGSSGRRVSCRSRTVPAKSPVAAWPSQESRSSREERRR